jgi:hypothetical protein
MNALGACQPVSRAHDECKLIPHDWRRFEIGFIG